MCKAFIQPTQHYSSDAEIYHWETAHVNCILDENVATEQRRTSLRIWKHWGWLTFNSHCPSCSCASRFTSTTFSSWTCFLTSSPCRLSLSLTGAASSLNQGSASSCSMFPVPAALASTWENQHLSEEWLIWLVLTYVQGCVSFFLMTKKTWIILFELLVWETNLLCGILTLRSTSCLGSKQEVSVENSWCVLCGSRAPTNIDLLNACMDGWINWCCMVIDTWTLSPLLCLSRYTHNSPRKYRAYRSISTRRVCPSHPP